MNGSIAGTLPDAGLIELAVSLQEFAGRRRGLDECCGGFGRYLGAMSVAIVRFVGDPERDGIVCQAPADPDGAAELVAHTARLTADLAVTDGPLLIRDGKGRNDRLLLVLAERSRCRYVLVVLGCREREALVRIVPLLRAAMAARDNLDRCRASLAVSGALLDHSGNGLVAVDSGGYVLYRNRIADGLFSGGPSRPRLGTRLVLEARVAQARLEQVLAALNGGAELRPASVMMMRAAGGPLEVTLAPVLMAPPDTFHVTRRCVLVTFRDPERHHVPEIERLRQSLGLTPAEARVAQEFCRNPHLRSVSLALGISPYTAKTHLLRIYQRLGVRSRAELLRRLQDHSGSGNLIVIDEYPDFRAT